MSMIWGCKETTLAGPDLLCTPKAYVFCRCVDRSEGTKQCAEDGRSFADCFCGGLGEPPPLSPDGPDFEPIDAIPSKTDAGLPLDDRCAGKLAVLASSAEDIYLYGAAYKGKGAWDVSKSQGAALRAPPRGTLVNGSLVAVWLTRYSLIAWTKFEAGQTTLLPPVSVGSAMTKRSPSILSTGTGARMFYATNDDTFATGTYSSTTGWDDASTELPIPGTTNVKQKSAPSADAIGGRQLIAFTGEGTLATQTQTSTSWGAQTKIAGAQTFDEGPAVVALESGAEDLLIVYLGTDLLLHSVARTKSTGVWKSPILVDTAANASGPPAVTELPDGRVLLVWQGVNGTPLYSTYGGSPATWTRPSAVLPNLRVISTPTVSRGRCASQATATLVDDGGNVNLALFDQDKWKGPYVVPGMTKMTYAGAGEVP
jgi:hypothetical protein